MLIFEIEKNAEGAVLVYLMKEGAEGGRRIAGPKAWGGSRNIARIKIKEEELVQFIKDEAPDIVDAFRDYLKCEECKSVVPTHCFADHECGD